MIVDAIDVLDGPLESFERCFSSHDTRETRRGRLTRIGTGKGQGPGGSRLERRKEDG